MTEESSPQRARREKELHIRVTPEGMAAIDALAGEDSRTRSDMARVLLSEAVEARRKKQQ